MAQLSARVADFNLVQQRNSELAAQNAELERVLAVHNEQLRQARSSAGAPSGGAATTATGTDGSGDGSGARAPGGGSGNPGGEGASSSELAQQTEVLVRVRIWILGSRF